MSYTITRESFDSLASHWADPSQNLRWSSVFVLPAWLKTWWQAFGTDQELYLVAARQGEKIIGIAPLMVQGEQATLVGSVDVCDYLDFVVSPGAESDFFNALLDDLRQQGISHLDLRPLRPDSTVLTNLVPIAQNRKYPVSCQDDEGVSVELDLPPSWDEYLATLSKKQRHEVRRKLRRLWETDNVDYRCVEVNQGVGDFMDTFLKLFSLSREDKASFMTARMASFFRTIAEAMAGIGLLRFGIIELDRLPVAMILGFDFNETMYLYNSAYDPQYNYLSVGLLCKVLCLKESIQENKQRFDFLKGDETYKYYLGGSEIPLYHCQITIK